MGGTFLTILIVFIVLGIFFKMGPQESAPAQQAKAPEPAPPSAPSSSGGAQDPFKAPGT